MKNWLSLFAAIIIITAPVFSVEHFYIDEDTLVEALEQKGVPERELIFAEFFGAETEKLSTLDKLEFRLKSDASFLSSDETSFSPLKPATLKGKNINIGIEKPTKFGIKLGLKYSTEQFTAGSLTNATSSKLYGEISADLYKDLFGMVSRNRINVATTKAEEAKLLKKIKLKGLALKLRGLYWDYVAANESFIIAKKLENSAKNQIGDIITRKRSGVADRGDLARFKAQYTERKAQVIQFAANKSIIAATIKTFLPELQGKKILLKKYNLKTTVKEFYSCLDVIAKHKKIPLEFTLYDDVIRLQKERYTFQKRVTNSYDKMDLILYARKGIDGKHTSISDANSEMFSNKKAFHSFGINLNIPLGGSLNRTYKAKANLDYSKFMAESKMIDLRLTSFHETIVETINLLKTVIANRINNIKQSGIGLKDSKRKYRQARITSQQLVHEEDQYLANSIKLIELESYVIKIMFDYFTLFTETPCKLN